MIFEFYLFVSLLLSHFILFAHFYLLLFGMFLFVFQITFKQDYFSADFNLYSVNSPINRHCIKRTVDSLFFPMGTALL